MYDALSESKNATTFAISSGLAGRGNPTTAYKNAPDEQMRSCRVIKPLKTTSGGCVSF